MIVPSYGKPRDFSRFLTQAESCLTHDAWEELPRIFCPTLIIGGTEDRIVTAEGSRELAGQIGGAELFLYEGLSHALYEEAVKKFQKANDLTVDGLAGADTQGALKAVLKKKNNASTSKQVTPKTTEKFPTVLKSILPEIAAGARDPVFGGDYSTLCNGSVGNRVKTVQTIAPLTAFTAPILKTPSANIRRLPA